MSRGPASPSLAGVRWRFRRDAARPSDVPLDAIERALATGRARNEKTGRRKALYPIHAEDGQCSFLLKRQRYGPPDALRRAGRGSKARHELAVAEALAARGLPVVAPLAAGERRRGPLLADCWLVIPYLSGARDLLALLREPELAPAPRRALARELGALSRAAHEAGLLQDDFAPNNFLHVPGETPSLRLIDFERARLAARPASDAWRRWMLAKLERALPDVSAAQRFRFLMAYARNDRAIARRWWHAVDSERARLARRDVARWRRNARRDGRRFRVVALRDARGWARRGFDDAAIAAALAGAGARVDRFAHPGPRALARLWGDAQLLAARGLGVPWLACVARGHEAYLIAAADAGVPADEAGVRRLARRLLQLGTLDPAGLGADSFVHAPGPGPARALLASPRAFRFRTPSRPDSLRNGSARARALARQIFGAAPEADSVARSLLR